jgi:hypothetical protein
VPIILDEKEYAALMWALRRIAGGYRIEKKSVYNRPLSRDVTQLIARDACDQFGWGYGKEMVEEYVGQFGYDDPPAHHDQSVSPGLDFRKVLRTLKVGTTFRD